MVSLFKKADPQDLPVPQVRALADRGYSENDIREILSKKGYNENEISLTLQRALAMKVAGSQSSAPQQEEHHSFLPELPKQPLPKQQSQPLPREDRPFASIGARQEDVGLESAEHNDTPQFNEQPVAEPQQEGYEVDLEPIVESIVEEKWSDITSNIESLRDKMEDLEKGLKESGPTNNAEAEYYRRQLEEKMEKFENSLDETAAKVAAIERAFKQFIPSLTGNIKALSDAVKRVKAAGPVPEDQ